MSDLRKIIDTHNDRPYVMTDGYIPVYETFLSRFRNKSVNMLEIGIFKGGSLQIWKKYLGKKARIYGLDIDPACKEFEENRINIMIGDQEDKRFMSELADGLPPLDIILDDGGHTMAQQINTFEILYPKLAWNGVYICEDVATSYFPNYGGGLKRKGTFIEFMKDKIDSLHGGFVPELNDHDTYKNTLGIHFYSNMVVLEKQRMRRAKFIKPNKANPPASNP